MRVKNEGQKWGAKMRGKNEGQEWGSKMTLTNEGQKWESKWGSKMRVKCLKGHKSLRSLCNVVKALIVSLVRQSYRPRDGPWVLLSCSEQLKIMQCSLKEHNVKSFAWPFASWDQTRRIPNSYCSCSCLSQKRSLGDILVTESRKIDPLVSKQKEKVPKKNL